MMAGGRIQLRSLVRIMAVVMYALVLLVQGAYFQLSYASASQTYLGTLKAKADQLGAQTRQLLDTINASANTISYNNLLSEFAYRPSVQSRVLLSNRIFLLLEAVTTANPAIKSMAYTDLDLLFIGNSNSLMLNIRRELLTMWRENGPPSRQEHLLVTVQGEGHLVCVTPSYQNKFVYVVYDLASVLWNSGITQDEQAVLLNGQENILHATDNADPDALWEVTRAAQNGNQGYAGTYSYAVSAKDDALNWQWICIAPGYAVFPAVYRLLTALLIADVVLLVVLLIYLSLLERNITGPIKDIVHFVDTMKDHPPSMRITNRFSFEIAQIVTAINRMLDLLSQQNEEAVKAQKMLYELKLLQKQTELEGLVAQINPHFLYNTLDCIRSMALVKEQQEIADIILNLVELFRYSTKGYEFVTLGEEIEIVNKYIDILQMRYRNRFEVHIKVPEELLNRRILRMTLQPIVENAFFHGLERIVSGGRISIQALKTGEKAFCITIEDNGAGIPPQAMGELQAMLQGGEQQMIKEVTLKDLRGIGLANIQARIRLKYGTGFGLRIESQQGTGTRVILLLPFIQ